MWLANAVINWEDRLFPTLILDLNPMTAIRFDDGSTLTIKDETVASETERLTKVFNYLARRLPRYGAGQPSDDLREQFY